MPNKYVAIVALVILTGTFAAGRYSVSTPGTKTVTDIKLDTVKDVDQDRHKQTTTTTEQDPTGKVKTITVITEDTETKKHIDTASVSHQDIIVTPAKLATLNVSALAGVDFLTYRPVYGASITKQLIGPVTMGAFGLTNGVAGISIGLNF